MTELHLGVARTPKRWASLLAMSTCLEGRFDGDLRGWARWKLREGDTPPDVLNDLVARSRTHQRREETPPPSGKAVRGRNSRKARPQSQIWIVRRPSAPSGRIYWLKGRWTASARASSTSG
jgi:hypothetical protein